MSDWTSDRVGAAERGENPTLLCRMNIGGAVIGDTQHLPGYCLLLYAGQADHLTDLPRSERIDFLADLVLLGEAVETACSALDLAFARINYEILGNSWHHLHGHVHACYRWEPHHLLRGPIWRYGDERNAPKHQLGSEHDELRTAITDALATVMVEDR